jgi:cell division septation protein DedD
MKRKTSMIAVAGLVAAGFMFYLGVMTERHWAARRSAVANDSGLARRVAEAVARADADADVVDVNALDFPEALRCLDPRPEDLALAGTDSTAVSPGVPSTVQPSREPMPDETAAIFLQLGAFGNETNAERFMASLSANGFQPRLHAAADDAQHPIYRVRIGPFATPLQAAATMRRLEHENLKYLVVR